jgi:transcription elongation GreA/GreB family factor
LTIDLGRYLDHLTRKPLLRKSLRMMRGPASAAGLGELQSLLETGFDAFAVMRGAQEFLQIVETRERDLAERLFAANVIDRDCRQGGKLGMGLP